jgi:hypothetical protein
LPYQVKSFSEGTYVSTYDVKLSPHVMDPP